MASVARERATRFTYLLHSAAAADGSCSGALQLRAAPSGNTAAHRKSKTFWMNSIQIDGNKTKDRMRHGEVSLLSKLSVHLVLFQPLHLEAAGSSHISLAPARGGWKPEPAMAAWGNAGLAAE